MLSPWSENVAPDGSELAESVTWSPSGSVAVTVNERLAPTSTCSVAGALSVGG